MHIYNIKKYKTDCCILLVNIIFEEICLPFHVDIQPTKTDKSKGRENTIMKFLH